MFDYISIDFETANEDYASICQVGMAFVKNNEILNTWSSYINPEDDFTNTYIHGITSDMVKNSPNFIDIMPELHSKISNNMVVSYGGFDLTALRQARRKYSLQNYDYKWINVHRMVRRHFVEFSREGFNLENIASYLKIQNERHHDAENDAVVCAKIVNNILLSSQKDINWWSERINKPIFDTNDINQEINIDGDLFGELILFTGTLSRPRHENSILANKIGASVANSVSKKISMLIVGDQDLRRTKGNEFSGKHRAVLDLNRKGCCIKILKESDFLEFLNASGVMERNT